MQRLLDQQISDLRRAIEAQESLRPVLGADVVDVALAVLRQRLFELERRQAEERNRELRKMVTVMVADISGFTALAEKMDEEEISEVMNRVWARVDAIIQTHGGHIEKHMGDNVVALWGMLTTREDDSEQAVRAALEIQKELPHLTLDCPCQMHIAVHSGPVMLGEVGSTREFSAIGRTVQIASLLEAEAAPGEVVISHETFRLVRGLFEVEPRGELPLSGYERPLPLYRIVRPRPYAFRPRARGVEGIETRMIGRKAELHVLQDALQQVAASGRARMVTVVGEAGIGKSRLLYEFEQSLSPRARSFWILQARAVERSVSVPYSLLRDVIMRRLGIPEDTSLDLARHKMERAVQSLLPDDPAAHEKAHFIGHLLGLDFSSTPELSGILSDPSQIRDRARHSLLQVIAAMATRMPVLFLLEDLHWADEASLDLLAYLLREGRSLPVLLVAVTRPTLLERLPDWWERIPGQQRLDLQPLDEASSRLLLREILQKVAVLPAALEELVIHGAEGNPFYLEELVKMLIDEGVIATGEIWTVDETRLGQARVPPTLMGILQARLDALPETERTALQAASVLGRVFWENALVALTGWEAEFLAETLDRLEARGLIRLRLPVMFTGGREFLFAHALLRQTAYDSLSKRQRKAYHLTAGQWLASRSQERASELAALVAGHFEAAEDWGRAALWYGQAGRQAYETYAPQAAEQYCRKALQFARLANIPDAERMDWQETLGKALFALARYEEALNAYQEMRAIADAAASVDGWARAWYHISYVHDHLGNHTLSLESAENALRLADKGARPELVIRAVYGKGWALYRLGDANSAVHLGELALRLARNLPNKIDSQREMAQACQLLGAAYELRGELHKSAQYEQRALELYRSFRDRRGEAAMLNNQGVGAFVRGDYQAALRRYEEALRVAREIGSHERVTVFLSNLGGARAALGQFQAAEADLRQVLERVGTAKTHYLPLTHVFLAEALLGQGRLQEACESAQTGLRLAQESAQPDVVSSAYRVLGNCAARSLEHGFDHLCGQTPEACYRESIRVAEAIGAEAEKARALRDWARFEAARGSGQQADSLRAQALALFRKLGLDLEVRHMENE